MGNERITGYSLSRAWFDFAFENQGIVNANHTAMYMWFIELKNRMGWAHQFYAPASQTMSAIGIKSYNTYIKTFNELVGFGFITLIKKSENQYQACIIALSNFDKSLDKSLDKSVTHHLTNHSTNHLTNQKEYNKTINNKPKTINKERGKTTVFAPPTFEEVLEYLIEKSEQTKWPENACEKEAQKFIDFYSSKNWMVGKNKMAKWKNAVSGWINRADDFGKNPANNNQNRRGAQAVIETFSSLIKPTNGNSNS